MLLAIVVLYQMLGDQRKMAEPVQPAVSGQKLTEGKRHGALMSYAGKLINTGTTKDAATAMMLAYNDTMCNPPKPRQEVMDMVDYVIEQRAGDPRWAKTADGVVVVRADVIDRVDECVDGIIATKNIAKAYEPESIDLMARGGTIKFYEAKRRLRDAFGKDLSVRELDARVKAAEIALRQVSEVQSPYILNSEGGKIANLANAITMIMSLPLQFDSLTLKPFLTATSPWGTIGEWTDNDDTKVTEWCQRDGLNIDIRTGAAAAQAVAFSRHPHYHPIREYLRAVKWDGEPRLSTWMRDRLGVPDTEYSRNVARKWMISAVKRVMEPGCQADYTLVLEGSQGKRKSTALRTLCGHRWFTDDIAEIGSKDSAMQLQGKWIVEIAELDAFRRAEITTIKAWLVRPEDHFRPPYGRRTADYPRQNVFAASTNKEDWGMDDTGLRRFWPVKVGAIDIDGLIRDRDQLWAEAVFAYDEGELSYFSDNIEKIANVEQHERQHKDAWKDLVEGWIESPGGMNTAYVRSYRGHIYIAEILQHCLDLPKKDWTVASKSRVTRILRLAGFVEKRATKEEAEPDGRRIEYWVPADVA